MAATRAAGLGLAACTGAAVALGAERLLGTAHSEAAGARQRPAWVAEGAQPYALPEWEQGFDRKANGWLGTDLCHHPTSPASVHGYWWDASRSTLCGEVTFTPAAESHKGLCHGGSMTMVMDDVVGHAAFAAVGKPWGGGTVQINTRLRAPVRVGETLRCEGAVTKREGRKVFVRAVLTNGDGKVHAECDGIAVEADLQKTRAGA